MPIPAPLFGRHSQQDSGIAAILDSKAENPLHSHCNQSTAGNALSAFSPIENTCDRSVGLPQNLRFKTIYGFFRSHSSKTAARFQDLFFLLQAPRTWAVPRLSPCFRTLITVFCQAVAVLIRLQALVKTRITGLMLSFPILNWLFSSRCSALIPK